MIDTLRSKFSYFSKIELSIGFSIVLVVAVISFSVSRQWMLRIAAVEAPPEIEIADVSVNLPPSAPEAETVPTVEIPEFENEVYPEEPMSEEGSVRVALTIPPKPLVEPKFSHASGSYFKAQFPLRLQISNANDLSTWVMVSVNRSGFKEHRLEFIEVHPEDYVQAYVRGDTERWIESDTISFFCKLKPGPQRNGRVPVDRVRFGNRR